MRVPAEVNAQGVKLDLNDDDLVLIEDEAELEGTLTALALKYRQATDYRERVDLICQMIETGVKNLNPLPVLNCTLFALKTRQEYVTPATAEVFELAKLRVNSARRKRVHLKKWEQMAEVVEARQVVQMQNDTPFHRELSEIICVMISEGKRIMDICRTLDINYRPGS